MMDIEFRWVAELKMKHSSLNRKLRQTVVVITFVVSDVSDIL